MKILIVEDSATMRRIIRFKLLALGVDAVVEAEGAEAAVALVRQTKFDLVITDRAMTGMNGVELIRVIRATPGLEHLPVLMITGSGDPEDVVEALDAGVNDYIIKPFTVLTLKDKIEALVPVRAKG